MNRSMFSGRQIRLRAGFTLIELLVVIAIIAILIALLIPAVQKVREVASRVECENNLKQIGVAVHSYHDVNQNMPPSQLWLYPDAPKYSLDQKSWSWMYFILPYVEQGNLYKLADPKVDAHVDRPDVIKTPVPTYMCPSDPASANPVVFVDWQNNTSTHHSSSTFNQPLKNLGSQTSYSRKLGKSLPVAFSSYRGCWGQNWFATTAFKNMAVGGMYVGDPVNGFNGCSCGDGIHFAQNNTAKLSVGHFLRFSDISDGLSNTFYAGETRIQDNIQTMWASTDDAGASCVFDLGDRNPITGGPWDVVGGTAFRFSSSHTSGVNFLYVDGSVHFVRTGIARATFRALSTYNGGEHISDMP